MYTIYSGKTLTKVDVSGLHRFIIPWILVVSHHLKREPSLIFFRIHHLKLHYLYNTKVKISWFVLPPQNLKSMIQQQKFGLDINRHESCLTMILFFSRGLYLSVIFFYKDNLLVTNEDQIPIVEMDDSHSSSIMQDFLWFTKVTGT